MRTVPTLRNIFLPVILASFLIGPLCAAAPTAVQPAQAQGARAAPDTAKDVNKLAAEFQELLARMDGLVKQLQATTDARPEDAGKRLDLMEQTMARISDRLRDDGDLSAQLGAAREAAELSRRRVAKIEENELTETDRNTIISKWTDVLTSADALRTDMTAVREMAISTLKEVRLHERALQELLLAGAAQQAIENVHGWATTFGQRVTELRSHLKLSVPGV